MNIEIVANNKDEILKLLEERKDVVLEALGIQAENYAKLNCPVDTGLLRNSITHAVHGQAASIQMYHADNAKDGTQRIGYYSGSAPDDDDSVYIGTNVEYAAYVECGTQRTDPQPFLKPAIEDHKNEYAQIIKTILNQ